MVMVTQMQPATGPRRTDEGVSFADTIRYLANWRQDGPCVSLICPTHGVDARGDPLEMRAVLREARAQVDAAELAGPSLEHLLDPVEELVGRSPAFWHHQREGLAIFRSPSLFRWMSVPIALPERAMVAERFHVRPMLALMVDEQPYLVLAISRHRVRLLMAHRGSVREVDIAPQARSIEAALGYDDLQKQNRYHVGERSGRGETSIHHGQGVGGEVEKTQLRRYFEVVAGALRNALRSEQAPMVLAGDAYELAMYRKVNTYPEVVEGQVNGNPDRTPDRELCEAARAEVLPAFRASVRRQQERYRSLTGTRRWSSDLAEIVRTAASGVVDALFVDPDAMAWGRFDPRSSAVELHADRLAGDTELLDLATTEALRHGGVVFPAGGASAVNAALRVPQR
jgi:Bacterial archaeo-eukaryotic release factor family 3